MPPAAEALPRWQATLNSCSSLAALRRAVRYDGAESPAIVGCRSLCWKTFLLFKDISPSAWIHSLAEARESYASTRDHLLKYIKHPEDLANLSIDPLADDPNSPWTTVRQDDAIREEIAQDVRRLPDEPLYQEERIQTMIIDILFIYCKLNPSVGDAVDRSEEDTSLSDSDRLMFSVLDSAFVEHDSFALFSSIMDRAASFYEVNDSPVGVVPPGLAVAENAGTSVIVEKSKFIHEVCLKRSTLSSRTILRASKSYPKSFSYVGSGYLLEADYSVCLQLLLKYPTPSPPHGPHTFVEDALYLKGHLTSSGATSLLMKYTGRVPQLSRTPSSTTSRPNTPSFPSLGSLRSRGLSPRLPLDSASKLLQQPGGVEALFQGAAKNVLERSEKLGINQAVRDAMGEIRRNMQTLQDNRPHPPRSGRDSAFSSGVGSPAAADAAVKALERRNQQLANLLDESLSGLRAITADVLEDKVKSLEMIEIAASKAQVVKLCLEDSSLQVPGPHLAEAEAEAAAAAVADDQSPALPHDEDADMVMDAAATEPGAGKPAAESPPKPAPAGDPLPTISSLSLADNSADATPSLPPSRDPLSDAPAQVTSPKSPERPKTLLPNRSSIAQSSFAWMLEPDTSVPAPLPSTTATAPAGGGHGHSSGSPSRGASQFAGSGGGGASGSGSGARLHKKRPSGSSSTRERNAFLFGEVVPTDAEVGVAAGVEARAIRREDIFGLEPIKRDKE
ncbi:unnamed protein product [Parascedosporium putredinis]|uniref:Rab-GAP TBC domain-containing protein n=1 Tax=Parascedosporium putredinis TaxID=1442378 RepID=A0A9P1GWW1_9PEZI|nr:unnamed protein product [Parascedosporium putredinis]CAI7989249.1 unnamed protein product [Parascedosporium putredinis]